eukprot:367819_1
MSRGSRCLYCGWNYMVITMESQKLLLDDECKDWIRSDGKGMGSEEGHHQKRTKSKHVPKAEEATKGEGTSKEPPKAEEAAEKASKWGTPSSKGGNEKEKKK